MKARKRNSFALFERQPQRQKSEVNCLNSRISSLYISNSQTKNVENKTSPTEVPSPNGVSSSAKPSETSSNAVPTQKPSTTTYKAFTTTYKSTSSTRTYINYTNRSDKLTEMERLRLREEFFATYDVMTGVRIAATLGGFFFLMVFLIVYKSRSHSNKALRVSCKLAN